MGRCCAGGVVPMTDSFYVETDPEGEPIEVNPDGHTSEGEPMFEITFYGTVADLVALSAVVAARVYPKMSEQAFASMRRRGKIVELDDD